MYLDTQLIQVRGNLLSFHVRFLSIKTCSVFWDSPKISNEQTNAHAQISRKRTDKRYVCIGYKNNYKIANTGSTMSIRAKIRNANNLSRLWITYVTIWWRCLPVGSAQPVAGNVNFGFFFYTKRFSLALLALQSRNRGHRHRSAGLNSRSAEPPFMLRCCIRARQLLATVHYVSDREFRVQSGGETFTSLFHVSPAKMLQLSSEDKITNKQLDGLEKLSRWISAWCD